MSHVLPRNVVSPTDRWTLDRVLRRGGPGGDALAIGCWDRKPALAQRWNGEGEHIKGLPVSNHQPVWFIVPDWAVAPLLDAAAAAGIVSAADVSHARRHLGLPDPPAPAAS